MARPLKMAPIVHLWTKVGLCEKVFVKARESIILYPYAGVEEQMLARNGTLRRISKFPKCLNRCRRKCRQSNPLGSGRCDQKSKESTHEAERETPPRTCLESSVVSKAKQWTVENVDGVAGKLCSYPHRFSNDNMDLAYRTMDPFEMDLEPETRQIEEPLHRRNPEVKKCM